MAQVSSGMAQRLNVQTTVSKEASSNGDRVGIGVLQRCGATEFGGRAAGDIQHRVAPVNASRRNIVWYASRFSPVRASR